MSSPAASTAADAANAATTNATFRLAILGRNAFDESLGWSFLDRQLPGDDETTVPGRAPCHNCVSKRHIHYSLYCLADESAPVCAVSMHDHQASRPVCIPLNRPRSYSLMNSDPFRYIRPRAASRQVLGVLSQWRGCPNRDG